jgi:hypothetical protein
MVSTDHFRQALRAQLGRAATQGHIDILVNSGVMPHHSSREFMVNFLLRCHAS